MILHQIQISASTIIVVKFMYVLTLFIKNIYSNIDNNQKQCFDNKLSSYK